MIQYQEFLQKKRHTTGNYKDRVSRVTVPGCRLVAIMPASYNGKTIAPGMAPMVCHPMGRDRRSTWRNCRDVDASKI